eukprot:3290321-Pyramimonas_sp.AAC.1
MQRGQAQVQLCEASPACWLWQRRQAFGVTLAKLAERRRLVIVDSEASCAANTFCRRLAALRPEEILAEEVSKEASRTT